MGQALVPNPERFGYEWLGEGRQRRNSSSRQNKSRGACLQSAFAVTTEVSRSVVSCTDVVGHANVPGDLECVVESGSDGLGTM